MLSRSARRKTLQQLKEARKTGRNVNVVESDTDDYNEIYDEVDEDTYRQHKRNQLMNDEILLLTIMEKVMLIMELTTGTMLLDQTIIQMKKRVYGSRNVEKEDKTTKVAKTSKLKFFQANRWCLRF